MTETVFWIFAAIAVLGGAMCVLQRTPVAALMWLVQTMLALGAIFVLLGAEFIGLIQILVYAGAILVLFLFIIMLLNLSRTGTDLRGPTAMAVALVLVGLLAVELAVLWQLGDAGITGAAGDAALPGRQALAAAAAERGAVGLVAAPLFETYLVPFEITSVLLLAAIVGAVVLAKRRV